MDSDNVDELQADVEQYADRAGEAYDAARERAAQQAGDYVRTYDSKVRRVAHRAPLPVEEAVGRYPWAALSAVLIGGIVVGFVTGTAMALLTRSVTSQEQAPGQADETQSGSTI